MKYILTGGGSGGHIYPLLSFAKIIQTLDKEAEFLFVGKKGNMEETIVSRFEMDFAHTQSLGTRGKITWQNVKAAASMGVGYLQAKKIIKEFKPDFCIGAGGYVSVPMMSAASNAANVKTVVFECDQFMGRANLQLAKKSDYIFSGLFDLSEKYFPNQANYFQVGDPRSEDLLKLYEPQIHARKFNAAAQTIVFAGGSLGAETINEYAIAMAKSLVEKGNIDVKVILVSGQRYFEEYQGYMMEFKNLEVLPYMEPMAELYLKADVFVTRSGAGFLAEIATFGLPSIAVPSPNVAYDHQRYNAKYFEEKKAIVMIEEETTSKDEFVAQALSLMADGQMRQALSEAIKDVAPQNAATKMYEIMMGKR